LSESELGHVRKLMMGNPFVRNHPNQIKELRKMLETTKIEGDKLN